MKKQRIDLISTCLGVEIGWWMCRGWTVVGHGWSVAGEWMCRGGQPLADVHVRMDSSQKIDVKGLDSGRQVDV